MFIEVILFQETSPALKKILVLLRNAKFSICLNNNSKDFAQASAGGVMNVSIVLNHSSYKALGCTERIATSPSLGYSCIELFCRLMM